MKRTTAAGVHEAYGRRGALPSGLRALESSMRFFGPAYPVASAFGDNLWLHRALARAPSGSVLVVRTIAPAHRRSRDGASRRRTFGYWGELMTAAARRRGLAGLLIDGHVRDREAIVESGFPVFCRGVSVRGTSKDPGADGSLGRPVEIGAITIAERDLVVGDADGVVVVAGAEAPAVVERARRLAERERRLLTRIAAGESTLQVLGLAAE